MIVTAFNISGSACYPWWVVICRHAACMGRRPAPTHHSLISGPFGTVIENVDREHFVEVIMTQSVGPVWFICLIQ